MLSQSIPDTSSPLPTVTNRTFLRSCQTSAARPCVWPQSAARSSTSSIGRDGSNLGANVGEAGSQTIGHAQLHIIPRDWGHVTDPTDGVRCLVPERSRNWEADERGNQP